ncbi:TetR/AcrR family transcriptional regulator [Sphingobium baderi]|uniref:HTH tetR-type domain-containing protein n=1 Tax=Sphingobium baderi TaxID=1332080 RepID=A0A0S3EWB5_9SPHN|nr:TetR/AcrR family transcriptional regulator [Sphingobium baderi]ALR19728.1 hypothetical protein ATN00_04800 [Sphingobium baderi]
MSDKKTRSIQRAVDVAIEAFRSHTLKDMSINLIAKEARCSTATIYEVFGSKDGLYRVAAEASIERGDHPRINPAGGPGQLDALFSFCEARIAHLADHGRGRGEHLLNSKFEISGASIQHYVRRELAYIHDVVEHQVDPAIHAGLMRPLNVAAVVHCIVSGTGFGPMVTGNYQLDCQPDVPGFMRLTFAPLLTEKGCEALEAYLAEPESHRGNSPESGKQRFH